MHYKYLEKAYLQTSHSNYTDADMVVKPISYEVIHESFLFLIHLEAKPSANPPNYSNLDYVIFTTVA